MLKLGDTDPWLIDKLGTLAARVVEDALRSGLSWDQAVVALGIAAKAMSAKAASEGGAMSGANADQYALHAEKRLKEGMDRSAAVLKAYLS
ncbi:MAG: hypothetical protein EOP92_20830 [Lysobacteraceae bacterium]|nr:MAG: hypothetical protein EOP92_20830 [Xanthomonadaceae bacterium]